MISIAMATYNGAKYLREQIDSILSQTIRDFELIVCDDCSTDETWKILEDYKDRDLRVKLYSNQHNIGFIKNFEKAIGLCSGEYIALSDQDDVWLPNHLEVLYNLIDDKMIACGNADMIDMNGDRLGLTLQEMESFNYVPINNLQLASSVIFFRNPFQGASMLIRRNFFSYALPIPNEIKYHDSWFANLASFCGGITYTERIVNKYRMHGNNVTGMRIKVRSKIRTFVSHLLFARMGHERLVVTKYVQERLPNRFSNEALYLEHIMKLLKRSSFVRGRLLNGLFLLRNYKTIFSADSSHWF